MDIKKFSKKDEEYFKKIDGKTVAVENVLMGDDEDIYDKKKWNQPSLPVVESVRVSRSR